jgi:hypothetical protein
MSKISHKSFFKASLEHPYDYTSCFLCAERLSDKNRTDEHVIPKWIQSRYDLWNQKLFLQNRTEIPYKNLTIPCCNECNNKLSKLEKEIREAIDSGFEEITKVSKYKIFQWIAKIFLGICYKELFLSEDRRNPDESTISSVEQIKEFSILHFWLQVYSVEEQSEFLPGSIFLFKTQKQNDIKFDFDLLDNIECKTISIRLGSVGIIADFLENGVHYNSMKDIIIEYQKYEYNPIQFRELSTKIFYNASLLNINTEVSFFEKDNGETSVLLFWKSPPGEASLFRKWDQSTYANILAYYLNIPIEHIFIPPNMVKSWMPWDVIPVKIEQQHLPESSNETPHGT